jgi:hypothetical protein
MIIDGFAVIVLGIAAGLIAAAPRVGHRVGMAVCRAIR